MTRISFLKSLVGLVLATTGVLDTIKAEEKPTLPEKYWKRQKRKPYPNPVWSKAPQQETLILRPEDIPSHQHQLIGMDVGQGDSTTFWYNDYRRECYYFHPTNGWTTVKS